MLHPVFRLAAAQPQLLAEHAAGYAELLVEEITFSGQHLKQRLALQMVGLVCLGIALVLAGVALLLWAALPAQTLRLPWLLIATPLAPALPGVLALWRASTLRVPPAFTALRAQLAADAELLRGSETP
jgi:uncharacterized membrane protein YqjE